MRKTITFCLFVLLVSFCAGQNQDKGSYSFSLNGNSIEPNPNFKEASMVQRHKFSTVPEKHAQYFIMQFYSIPTLEEQKQLEKQGVTLLDYLQANAYYVFISSEFYNRKSFVNERIRSLIPILPDYKINRQIALGDIPDYAKEKDRIKIFIAYFENADVQSLVKELKALKATSINVSKFFRQISANVHLSEIKKIASLPWVQNIQLVDPPMELDNSNARSNHRANVLNSQARGLGYGLTGKGVKIGLWDGNVDRHRDFGDRITRREFEIHTTDHGTHTCGTIAGAGIIDPKARGMAPESEVIAWNFNIQSNGLVNAQERLISLEEDGIEITSNSFGVKLRFCPNINRYGTLDEFEDLLSYSFPYFLFVYSGGNDQDICNDGYRTTSKNLKNSLIVAAINKENNMSSFSSFGPSFDGRLIPNISGDGVHVYSTALDQRYVYLNGTSMATPGVAGTMALLYQRYKETHGGKRPLSSLFRGLACNTATDLGNPGPDYKFGYGAINGNRAIHVMEQNTYFTDTLSQGKSCKQEIVVPQGAVALRVMLSWTDRAGISATKKVLINDLDLTVSNNGKSFLPWVLDPNNPSAVAKRGVDDMNNLEQVTISNPPSGTYTINVAGKAIPKGVQQFSVVYDVVMPTLQLTYPIGGEFFAPSTLETIHWDAEGCDEPFVIEYSMDNGISYSKLAEVDQSRRAYSWKVPDDIRSKQMKIRVISGAKFSETKGVFHIMPFPKNVKVGKAQCDGTGPFKMEWDTVSNAKYEVLKLKNERYEHLAYVEVNSYDITDVQQGNDNYFCVRAIDRKLGAISERSIAVTVNPSKPVIGLPFKEDFEEQVAPNFYFSATKGFSKGSVQYILDKGRYAIVLEGGKDSTKWVDSTGMACFDANPNYIAKATICNVDFSSYTGKMLMKFDFRQKYSGMKSGTSYFRVKANGNILKDVEGNQIFGNQTIKSYKTLHYDMSAYAGQSSIAIEFESVCKKTYVKYKNPRTGSYNYSYDFSDKGDFVAIDNIEILESKRDLELTDIGIRRGKANNQRIISLKVTNKSLVEVSNIPVSYQVEGMDTVKGIIANPITSLQDTVYVFEDTLTFMEEGIYNMKATVSLPNDFDTSNNSISMELGHDISSIRIGKEPKVVEVCTGVFTDDGGKYLNYSSRMDRENSIITFKPLDPVNKASKITFSEFDLEKRYDFLYVYNGPSTSSPLLAKLNGEYKLDTTTDSKKPKKTYSFISSATGGELTFRLSSDISVAKKGWVASIECINKPVNDIELISIKNPLEQERFNSNEEEVRFEVKNNGIDTVNMYKAYYTVNGKDTVDQVFNTKLGTLNSEEKVFDVKADLSRPGNHEVKVWVEIPNDEKRKNDSAYVIAKTLPQEIDLGISYMQEVYPARKKFSEIGINIKNYGTLPVDSFEVAYRVNEGIEVSQIVKKRLEADKSVDIRFDEKADLTGVDKEYSIEVYVKKAGDIQKSNDTISKIIRKSAVSPTNMTANFVRGKNTFVASTFSPVNLVNNYTIECWVNLQQPLKYGHVFNKNNVSLWHESNYGTSHYGENTYILDVITDSSEFRLYVPKAVKYNTWQHLALTVSSSNVYTLYVDGISQKWVKHSGTVGPTKKNDMYPICIGNRPKDKIRPVEGKIDEFRVWNTCLDQATIKKDMMTDFEEDTPNMIAYYKFSEGSGKYVYDYSVNDNTAIVVKADLEGVGEGKFWNTPGELLKDVSIVDEKVPTVFDSNTHTFTSIMDNKDLTNLTAKFKAEQQSTVKVGTVVQESGKTVNDFTAALTYTVEGVGFNKGIVQNYVLKVSNDLSSECELNKVSFMVSENSTLSQDIHLDRVANSFEKKLPYGTDLTALKATFDISPNASVLIGKDVHTNPQTNSIDYSQPLMVKIVSQNGRFSNLYKIDIDAKNDKAELIKFAIKDNQVGETVIGKDNKISLWVKNDGSVRSSKSLFEVSPKAKVYVGVIPQYTGITLNDFNQPVTYTVVSENDSVSSEWIVTASVDTVKPMINLKGDASVKIIQGSEYVDEGAVATDNLDGDISTKIIKTGFVDTKKPNTYVLNYSVEDASGNKSDTISRNVEVLINTAVDNLTEKAVNVYSDGNYVYVIIPEIKDEAKVTICNILGVNVYTSDKLSLGRNVISEGFVSGTYIVKVEVNSQVVTKAIVIK